MCSYLEGIVASWLIAENSKVQVAAAIQVCDQVHNHIQLTLCTAGECESVNVWVKRECQSSSFLWPHHTCKTVALYLLPVPATSCSFLPL